MMPRAAVCADRIGEVLDTEPSVADAGRAGRRRSTAPGTRRASTTSSSPTRAPRSRCCATSRFTARAGQTTAIIGSHRRGQDDARQPPRRGCSTPPAARVLVDGVDVRDARPRLLWTPHRRSCRRSRTCSPAPSRRTCATASRTPPTTSSGTRSRSRRPRTSSRRCPAARRADRAGRHQRVRRAAAAARDRPGPREAAGDLRLRRLVLGARHSRRTPGCARRSPRDVADATHDRRRPARLDDRATPTRSSCSRTARIVGRGTHEELLETLGDLRARSSRSQLDRGGGSMSEHRRPRPRGARRAAPGPPRRGPMGGGPFGGAGMPAEKSMNFWPSREAPARPARGPSGSARGRRRPRSASSASCSRCIGPKHPRRGDEHHLRGRRSRRRCRRARRRSRSSTGSAPRATRARPTWSQR